MSDGSERQSARIRRAPRLGVFVLLGAVIGIVVAVIVTGLFPSDPSIGFWASAGYFSIYGLVFGALLGAIIGLVLDAVLRRRARRVVVERDSVAPAEAPEGASGDDAESDAS